MKEAVRACEEKKEEGAETSPQDFVEPPETRLPIHERIKGQVQNNKQIIVPYVDNESFNEQSADTIGPSRNDTGVNQDKTKKKAREAQIRAHVTSLLTVNWCEIALTPGIRTSLIVILDWIIFGIGNANSTAFQLGALYVGLTDPNGNLGKRLRGMGLTLFFVVVVGTWLPCSQFDSVPGTIIGAICAAFLTGCSPLLDEPALSLAMKLATALFAIQGTVHRHTNGYGGTFNAVIWTLFGGSCSLLASILPELFGNRDAIRTDLFKVWHGFGCALQHWKSRWGTSGHTDYAHVPYVTLSICSVLDLIENDKNEEPAAKDWLLKVVDSVDTIRMGSLCLTNGNEMIREWLNRRKLLNESTINEKTCREHEKMMDDLFLSLATIVRAIGYAFHFPWVVHQLPPCKAQIERKKDKFIQAAEKFQLAYSKNKDLTEASQAAINIKWLPSLVELLKATVDNAAGNALDNKRWPSWSSPSMIPNRIISAVPRQVPKLSKDPDWVIRGYAVRFTTAYTIATVTALFMPRGTSAHWFPMTVTLIMGPAQASTYEKVGQRTIGTLGGIALGSILSPLFQYPAALITLLGLNTYGVCFFFRANYAMFTFFITSWVFCTTVGVGAPMGLTILYRCLWTLAAALLVVVVTYTYRQTPDCQLTKLLAEFAQAVKRFTEVVLLQREIIASENQIVGDFEKSCKDAYQSVKDAKRVVSQKRLAVFAHIRDAVLMPAIERRVDAHYVAPLLASDLVDAVVIPLFLSMVNDDTCDNLFLDLESGVDELDRLSKRLEAEAGVAAGGCRSDENPFTKPTTHRTKITGPFTKAIASAHSRLDEAEAHAEPMEEPPSTTKQKEEMER